MFVGELQERLGEAAMDILGWAGPLSEEAPSAPIPDAEQILRHSPIGVAGGGTGEQRNTIALRGLKLPRDSSDPGAEPSPKPVKRRNAHV
ncbi:MAG TPA: hypothetical protein VJR87_01420 [Allosphingosinicella sp.]|nr:hypothetical protein [Allosphingosinicella sp.]